MQHWSAAIERSRTLDDWTQIDDSKHFDVWRRFSNDNDARTLYDSYVWRQAFALAGVRWWARCIEILPGTSMSIPIALESVGFGGELLRADATSLSPITVP